MTEPTETARELLWRHQLPEDVIDGALALFAQELAGKIRARFDGSIIDDVREQDADLISPENWARPEAPAVSAGVAPATERECAASISGHCLAEGQSETACDTDAGECVHGGKPATGQPGARFGPGEGVHGQDPYYAATDQAALRDRIAAIRKRHAALAGRDWEAAPHQHRADGCRCLSCYDDPTGWQVDHSGARDCVELVATEANDFGRGRASCDDGPLLTYEEADALAHAAEDIGFLLDHGAAVLPASAEEHRLALSEALGLGTGAPWDAIHDRATELGLPPLDQDPAARRLGLVSAPADRAAVYAEVADRLAADAEQGAKEGFTRIYRRSAAKQVREWGEDLRRMAAESAPADMQGVRTAPEQAAAAQQPICKCPAEICQCGHHKAQQPKEA